MKDYRIPQPDLDAIADRDLAWAVIEPMWDDLDFGGGYRKVMGFLESVTQGQSALISLDWCQKEVRNGGFEQFFMNSTGMLSDKALAGFRLIGADCYADLLAKALSCFPEGKAPPSASGRRKILRSIRKAERDALLDSLDTEFYELLEAPETDLESFRGAYIRNNPDQFFSIAST
jgi:hypothetical protein